jgi:phosphate:Na+ symporter
LYNERVKNLYGEIIEYSILAQTTNETEYHEDFSKVKIATSLIAESVKIVINMQSKLAKYLKSTNSEIKEQYENIIKELIDLLVDINRLREEKNDNKSLDIYFGIEKSIEDKNIISNGTIDKLIREQKISNEMATSLINDSNDKIEMFGDLARVAEIIFHNNVSDKKADLNKKEGAHWLEDNLSGKKLEKVIEKLQRRLKKLQKELKETKKKDVEKKEKLQREIESVEFLLGKYGKNRKK